MQFMKQGGHVLSPCSNIIQARRGKKLAALTDIGSDMYYMNKYAKERYIAFLNYWLENGAAAIEELRENGKKSDEGGLKLCTKKSQQ